MKNRDEQDENEDTFQRKAVSSKPISSTLNSIDDGLQEQKWMFEIR